MSRRTRTKQELLRELVTTYRESVRLSSVAELLEWDQEILMPKKAAQHRAVTVGYLSGLSHTRLVALGKSGVLEALLEMAQKGLLKPREQALVRECERDVREAITLPTTFVETFAETTSNAVHVWQAARREKNFKTFALSLEKIVALSREKARYIDAAKDPYDVLLDTYEPDTTCDMLEPMFAELRDALVPIVYTLQHARKKSPARPFKGAFPVMAQRVFSESLARRLGLDEATSRLDESVHPFTVGIHPHDVRITTRYDSHEPWFGIGSTIHESGHALYELGLPVGDYGTPLGQARSLGVHESQSRFWENMLGKRRSFWEYFYPMLRKAFPDALKGVSSTDWYAYLHRVQPSFIRTEADEVTYNLHIIVRFEIERMLISGTLAVKDLPEVWNEKMYEYLGLRVPNDAAGVLQDTHWASGLIGYFPTYTLGNLYAAALFDALMRDVPNLDERLAKGDFRAVREWLQKKIYRYGRTYSAQKLMHRATGTTLSVEPFLNHIRRSYITS